ncbi:hypothetical protein BURMUCF2_0922 [Burkholderia multivorans CF2]|nr:hypothetical protein BURMUCF2_0922 [Burkholderia multivorans CF2]
MRVAGPHATRSRLLQKSIQSSFCYESLPRLAANLHRHTNLHERFDFQDCNTPAKRLR